MSNKTADVGMNSVLLNSTLETPAKPNNARPAMSTASTPRTKYGNPGFVTPSPTPKRRRHSDGEDDDDDVRMFAGERRANKGATRVPSFQPGDFRQPGRSRRFWEYIRDKCSCCSNFVCILVTIAICIILFLVIALPLLLQDNDLQSGAGTNNALRETTTKNLTKTPSLEPRENSSTLQLMNTGNGTTNSTDEMILEPEPEPKPEPEVTKNNETLAVEVKLWLKLSDPVDTFVQLDQSMRSLEELVHVVVSCGRAECRNSSIRLDVECSGTCNFNTMDNRTIHADDIDSIIKNQVKDFLNKQINQTANITQIESNLSHLCHLPFIDCTSSPKPVDKGDNHLRVVEPEAISTKPPISISTINTLRTALNSACYLPKFTFTCQTGGDLLQSTQRCDNKADCHDSSDEADCPGYQYKCPEPTVVFQGTFPRQRRLYRRSTHQYPQLPLPSGAHRPAVWNGGGGNPVTGRQQLTVAEKPNPHPTPRFPPSKPPNSVPQIARQTQQHNSYPGHSRNRDRWEDMVPRESVTRNNGQQGAPLPPSDYYMNQPITASILVQCPGSGICISFAAVCDGVDDCPMGLDEVDCALRAKTGCSLDQRSCKNGQCIQRTKWCDGTRDCSLGEDEEGCDCNCTDSSQPCAGRNLYLCAPMNDELNRRCIKTISFCNGIPDCPGEEDEHEVFCAKKR